MTYTLRLLSLECVTPQEVDGDETYLTLDERRIWVAEPDKMSHPHSFDKGVSLFDFAEGRKKTDAGWAAIGGFQPEWAVFSGLSGRSMLQLWDADTFTPDDLLGETPIDETQASGGAISVVFQRQGAHYRLTYKVELD